MCFIVIWFTIVKNTIYVFYRDIHSENILYSGESSSINSTLVSSVFIVAMFQWDLHNYKYFSSQQQVNLQCVWVLQLCLLWEMLLTQHVKRLANQKVGTKWVSDFLLLLFFDG
jgi:hypothetical protein